MDHPQGEADEPRAAGGGGGEVGRGEGAALSLARSIAAHVHRHHVDKAGRPYLGHVTAVAEMVSSLGPRVEALAWLHDVIEDSDHTVESLLRVGVPIPLVLQVSSLSRREGESYSEFIERVAKDVPEVIVVKIADLTHNLDPERGTISDSHRARYEKARKILVSELDSRGRRDLLATAGIEG